MSCENNEYRGLGPPLGPEGENRRLDLFLAQRFPFRSRQQWKLACQEGHLRVNGLAKRASHKLRSGDRLSVFHPLTAEPEVDTNITLLAEASGIIAVHKPANLPMHESGLYRRNTLHALVNELFGTEWAPVHRLDRETSGIVICAATAKLRNRLSLDFETRLVDKRYLAIVDGCVEWRQRRVEAPLILLENEMRPRYAVASLESQEIISTASEACTDFHVLETRARTSLLEVKPWTGRPHQIRVHAAYLGHHLVGDKTYHANNAVYQAYHRLGDTKDVQQLAGFQRHALHASAISIKHPETGRLLEVSSALPQDLQDLWQSISILG